MACFCFHSHYSTIFYVLEGFFLQIYISTFVVEERERQTKKKFLFITLSSKTSKSDEDGHRWRGTRRRTRLMSDTSVTTMRQAIQMSKWRCKYEFTNREGIMIWVSALWFWFHAKKKMNICLWVMFFSSREEKCINLFMRCGLDFKQKIR